MTEAGSPAVSSTRARASLLLEGARRRQEHIVSPEGVPLNVEVASYGDRLAAFILDSLFWTVATFLVVDDACGVEMRRATPSGRGSLSPFR